MSALVNTIFPKSEYSKCLHLEINSGKKTENTTIVKTNEGCQAMVACSDKCADELLAIISYDTPLCAMCSKNLSVEKAQTFGYGGNNYRAFVCDDCSGKLSESISNLNKQIECEECGKLTNRRCVCLKVGYCSKECQIKKRPTHKSLCHV
jgi:hypothetical protein